MGEKKIKINAIAEIPKATDKLSIYLVFVQFIFQFIIFAYLYDYIGRLENDIHKIYHERGIINNKGPVSRIKRSSGLPLPENNAVSEVFRVSFILYIYRMCIYQLSLHVSLSSIIFKRE